MCDLSLKILEALVAGPNTHKGIYTEVKPYASSEASFTQTLAKLRQTGQVQSEPYVHLGSRDSCSLYALTEDGAVRLVESKKYKRKEIRTVLPSENTVAHELAVTGLFKKVRWEMITIPYSAHYYDDFACRQNKKLWGLQGGIPDVLLDIYRFKHHDFFRLLALEFDNGTRKEAELLRMILTRPFQTLFVCGTRDRLYELHEEFALYREELDGLVYFALLYDFCARPGGIFGTNFVDMRGQKINFYPALRG